MEHVFLSFTHKRMRARFFVVLFLLTVLNGVLIWQAWAYWRRVVVPRTRLRVQQVAYRFAAHYVHAFDVDRDGEDELVYVSPAGDPPGYNVVGAEEPFAPGYIPPNFSEILVPESYIFVDAHLDPAHRHIQYRFLELSRHGLILRTIRGNQDDVGLVRLEYPNFMQGSRRYNVAPIVWGLNDDAATWLTIVVHSAWKKYPRGLATYDLATGQLRWEFPMGSMPWQWKIADLDGDGAREVIVSTFASNNGVRANGTDDAYSYVIVLDSDGRIRWIRQIGMWYTMLMFTTADLDGDYRQEVIVTLSCHRAISPEPGRICVLDSLTGRARKCITQTGVSFSAPYVLAHADYPRIVVGDDRGKIWMLDAQLRVIRSVSVAEPVSLIGGENSAISLPYILALTSTRLLVFDRDMQIKWSQTLPERIRSDLRIMRTMYFMRHRDRRCAVVNADGRIYVFCPEKPSRYHQIAVFFRNAGWVYVLMFALINGLVGFSAMAIVRPIRKQHARQRGEWLQSLGMMQEIGHRMKTPLATLLWSIERLHRVLNGPFSRQKLMDIATSMLEDTRRLRRDLQRLMLVSVAHVPEHQEVVVNDLLQDLLTRYTSFLQDRIQFSIDAPEPVTIRGDPKLLNDALANLFDNAIEAMPDGGHLRVTITPVYGFRRERRAVIIEIEDTGCGIRAEDIPRVFDPYYSTKRDGMGLGLTIARRIIEAHGGRIAVHSRAGFGTRVVIRLPV